MSAPRTRPAPTADERAQLLGWLDMQRAIVQWKCEGLSEEDAHRSVLPTSPLMTVAGVVAHLRWVEYLWFEVVLAGGSTDGIPQLQDEPEDAEMRVDGVPLAQLLDEYERQCAASNERTAAHALDDVSRHGGMPAQPVSLRWVLFHMIEETARHVGHLDTIRELLDGRKGYY